MKYKVDHHNQTISIYFKDRNILGYIDYIMTRYDEANHKSYTNPTKPPKELMELLVEACRPYYNNPGEDLYYVDFPLFGQTYDLTAEAVRSLESLN